MKVLPSGFHLNGHTIGSLSTETQKIYNYLAYKRHNSNIPEEFGTGRLILREAGLFYLILCKTDISLRRTHTAGPQGVRLSKS